MSTLSLPEVSTFPRSSKDTSKKFPVENPATGKVLTIIQGGDAATTGEAIEAAHQAFQSDWRWRSPAERSALLFKCADALEKHATELAELLCLENGKPMQDALMFDVSFVSQIFRYFASLCDKLPSAMYDRGNTYGLEFREPYGVCAGILPFNWPPIHTGGKIAPAIAVGNTFVLKPGEQAPLTAMRIVEILQTVLPPNVVQCVPGAGPEVPQTLASHPLVKKVSLTGSTAAGIAVSKIAADNLTPMTLELGGKNAFLIFEDADLDLAVAASLEGAFFNKGEACTASSRLLIHDSLYEDFVSRLGAAVKKLVVGNGMDKATHVGPVVSRIQQQKVLEYIRVGEKEGAVIAAQAPLPTDPASKDGFFVPPTLFRDVTRDMRIAQEEIFGPVVTATAFATEEEAISIANSSEYGLTAGIFSRDSEKAMRVARKLDVGMVWVNNYNRATVGLAFGGTKHSGFGREHCIETMHDYTFSKSIRIPSGLGSIPHWRGVAATVGKGA
ncbi:Aldehyde dehydrogenase citD [Lachnellula suecica]|uniref:aldehyde dehydrogenase (NAD(+)) n=1 Tax=Lachnellula suecica TaxID=602035 RepID=A0A8T9BVH3_9HELO|nr:Aldehyde dehydrogenase citD [Lachnellula suecica]